MMSGSYGKYVRGRLAAGDLAYYQLRVEESGFTADERQISPAKVERVVQRNYPVETAATDSVPNVVRVRPNAGLDAVVAAWLMDVRLLADRLRADEASREKANELMSVELRLADRVDDETAETVRERVRVLGDARGD